MSQQGLIRYCTPVINLYSELLWMDETLSDVSDLSEELKGLIESTEIELKSSGFHKTIVKHASYSLCCVIDAAINRVKGLPGQDMSFNESLLFSIHNESPDSTKILNLSRLLLDQKVKVDHSELFGLIYLLLEMGYEEQIQLSMESQDLIATIKSELSQKIASHHKPMISAMKNGFVSEQKKMKRRSSMPLWVSLSLVVLILTATHHIADLFLTKYYSTAIENLLTSNNYKKTP